MCILIVKLIVNLILIYEINSSSILAANTNQRIQCEFKDKDGESLVLNCSISNALTDGHSDNSGQQQLGNSLSVLSMRLGLDESWRTPWEALSVNHNIIRSIIWRNSKIAELGEYAFKDLNYLQRVDLSFNKLSNISSGVFRFLESDLIDLDLSHNLFQTVPYELFTNTRVQSLEILRLNENPIVQLNNQAFSLIRNSLKSIELNYCKIRSIEQSTFDQMKQLESISLIGNHLRSLSYNTFKDLTLRSFYIHDNPFYCDCHLRWLIDFIKTVDSQQQTYELVSGNAQQIILNNNNNNNKQAFSAFNYIPQISVYQAAQQYLKCDQPNSLKSKQNFLDINPDSFMCDIQLDFRDGINEAAYEIGDDALLICDVYGDPEPDVYWSFGQKPIGKGLANDDDKYLVNEVKLLPKLSSFQVHTTNKTSELRIKNIQQSDIGLYACTAEIKGSNNRKQIGFNLKQIRAPINLSINQLSNAGDLLFEKFYSYLNKIQTFILNQKNFLNLSNSSLILLLSVLVCLIMFFLILTCFICWKFSICCCCCCCGNTNKNKNKHNMLKKNRLLRSVDELILAKENEKLMLNNNDCLDGQTVHHQHTNYSNLANDSSATLLSNNKMSNSIRMAYPNYNNTQQHFNDPIYTNHSLLTTTSTTTGSYLANNHIAIDTSNQTPRYHLLAQSQHDSYYDDLRYNENHSSPFKQQQQHQQHQQQQSYSPIVRRDDPTVPLYATLKPKLIQTQHQRNYVQYSTIHRSTPPLPAPRKQPTYHSNLQLPLPPPPPPPPPPPQILPPVKPKRTFEYSINRDLHSESGAFLLANEDNNTNQSTPEQDIYESNYQGYVKIKRSNLLSNSKLVKMPNQNKFKNVLNLKQSNNGSTTSLDEEDLDLNDLKDFEDVTFDNLRKPGEEQINKNSKQKNQTIKQLAENCVNNDKNLLQLNTDLNTNSEQSLLIKSSSSSDKSASNNNINNDSPNTNTTSTSVVENTNKQEPKIYEETEI